MTDACCLNVDVAALADGHSNLIGDRGVTLSGGQRQRVSLARAVYSNRDIYLLDDPLASIDPEVALTVIRRVILDLLKDKTVLVVTNQLQVTALCQISSICIVRDVQSNVHCLSKSTLPKTWYATPLSFCHKFRKL